MSRHHTLPSAVLAVLLSIATGCRDAPSAPARLASPSDPHRTTAGRPRGQDSIGTGCPGVCTTAPARIMFSDTAFIGFVWSVKEDGSDLRADGGPAPRDNVAWLPQYDGFVTSEIAYGGVARLQLYGFSLHPGYQFDLTDGVAWSSQPAVSPDGTRYAYHQGVGSVAPGIYVGPIAPTPQPQLRLTIGTDDDQWPHWAPDGKHLVFASRRAVTGPAFHVWRMNADGTGAVQLSSLEGREPVYSPDGSRIAFSTPARDGTSRIAVMNADGSGATILTNAARDAESPTWSRDGRSIAFSSTDPAWSGIDVMRADGTQLRHLVPFGRFPRWSR